jgi:hypothetical protein
MGSTARQVVSALEVVDRALWKLTAPARQLLASPPVALLALNEGWGKGRDAAVPAARREWRDDMRLVSREPPSGR